MTLSDNETTFAPLEPDFTGTESVDPPQDWSEPVNLSATIPPTSPAQQDFSGGMDQDPPLEPQDFSGGANLTLDPSQNPPPPAPGWKAEQPEQPAWGMSFLATPDAGQNTLREIFSDPVTLGGHWTPQLQWVADFSADPQETKLSSANIKWIAAQENIPTDTIVPFYPAYRRAYSQLVFGKPDMGDREFYDAVAGKYVAEDAQREALHSLLGTVALDGIEALTTGRQTNPAELVQRYRTQNPGFFQNLAEQDERNVLSALTAASFQFQGRFQNYGHAAKKLYDAALREADPNAPAVPRIPVRKYDGGMTMGDMLSSDGRAAAGAQPLAAPTMEDAVAEMSLIPPEDRQMIYDAVTLAVKKKGFEPKSFWSKMGLAFGRSTIGAINQSSRVAHEQYLHDKLRDLQADPLADKAKIADVENTLNVLRVAREISALSEQTDPARSAAKGWLGLLQNASLDVAGAVGTMGMAAVPVIGIPLVFTSIYSAQYEHLALENPGVSPETLSYLAELSAFGQTALFFVNFNLFARQLPRTFKALRDIAVLEKGAVAAKYAGHLGAATAEGFVINEAQSLVSVLTEQIGGIADPQFRKHKLRNDLADWKDAAPEVLVTSFLLACLSAGILCRNIRNSGELLGSPEALEVAGFSKEQSSQIMAGADDTAKQARLITLWDHRTARNKAAGVKLGNKRAGEIRAQQTSPHFPTLEATLHKDGTHTFTARAADDTILLRTKDPQAAQIALYWEIVTNHSPGPRLSLPTDSADPAQPNKKSSTPETQDSKAEANAAGPEHAGVAEALPTADEKDKDSSVGETLPSNPSSSVGNGIFRPSSDLESVTSRSQNERKSDSSAGKNNPAYRENDASGVKDSSFSAMRTDFMTGRIAGKIFDVEKFSLLKNYLVRRRISLLIGDEFLPDGKAGGFNAVEGTLSLRSNPTQYEVWHEIFHFMQFRRLGLEKYNNLSRAQKEQFVFDQLENLPKRWNALNHDEQKHAIDYIERIGGFR